jgi:hypothetical protein
LSRYAKTTRRAITCCHCVSCAGVILSSAFRNAIRPSTNWLAEAMHENANSLDQAIKTARQDRGSMDAVQRLTLREQFAKVRAENEARLLAAFKPLYASLSPEQQQVANQLVAPHHERHHRA